MIVYQLHHGSCLEVLKEREPNSIDCVICDPPYRCTSRGTHGTMGGMFKEKNVKNGKGGFEHNSLTLQEYLPLIYKVMREGAHGYLMTNDVNLVDFHLALKEHGFKIMKTLIWAKNNPIANQFYMSSHEYIIFFRKGVAVHINNCGTRSVLNFNNPKPKQHPSQKPVPLLRVLVENSTKEGETVLDFTMGSGSTGVACMEAKRKFVGIEIDSDFFQLAKNNIEDRAYQLGLIDMADVSEGGVSSLQV